MAAILIVDDDEAVRDVLYDLFSDEHLCHVAATAEQALAFIDDQPYDVVLTDISMPGLSGLELLGHLRQARPGTPVIVISGIGDRSHAEGLIGLGAFDFMLKPFRLEEIEKSVGRALEYGRTQKRQARKGARADD
ncbi:MAG TPA: response regulator [Pyrinomonadaceae bacterium]|jgi:two-component system response regulator PilR (NtrC family)|nr:response regulator [Pyrinomonadaceae bacterium]